ncbi:MAG TPA: ribonuclease HI family protein [Armatimonadota bacterium]|nr:ribonuclease HI family protein [Armatimonadota bacterium]HQK96340.1 ribonuclease HI family protein [Armatimonadota bacterium]
MAECDGTIGETEARKTLLLNVDGGSRGNPGPAGIGVVIREPSGRVVQEISESIGRTTNNVAEYRAMIRGLETCRALNAQRVLVCSDSELLVRQMVGTYRVKAQHLQPLHEQATRLARSFSQVAFRQIPREQNAHADRLASEAIEGRAAASGDTSGEFELVEGDPAIWIQRGSEPGESPPAAGPATDVGRGAS